MYNEISPKWSFQIRNIEFSYYMETWEIVSTWGWKIRDQNLG